MTADIINLNKVRKARAQAEAEKQAEENRARFGRTKAEKENAARVERANDRTIDGAELTPATESRLDADHDDLDPGNVS
jgi:Domain of unknown function (DUF4169)